MPDPTPLPTAVSLPDAQAPPRPRGAQRGTQNAPKHGIYGRHLESDEAELLPELVKVKGVAGEIALVRLRIAGILRRKVSDEDFFEAIDLLNRLVTTHDRVTTFRW